MKYIDASRIRFAHDVTPVYFTALRVASFTRQSRKLLQIYFQFIIFLFVIPLLRLLALPVTFRFIVKPSELLINSTSGCRELELLYANARNKFRIFGYSNTIIQIAIRYVFRILRISRHLIGAHCSSTRVFELFSANSRNIRTRKKINQRNVKVLPTFKTQFDFGVK